MKCILQFFSSQMFIPSVSIAKYTLNYNEPWQHKFPINEELCGNLRPIHNTKCSTFDTWSYHLVVILLIYGQNSFLHDRDTKRGSMSNMKIHFTGRLAFNLSLFPTAQITRFPKGAHCCPHLYFTAVCSLQKLGIF